MGSGCRANAVILLLFLDVVRAVQLI